LRNTSHECKAITDWLNWKRLSQWPSSLPRGKELENHNIIKLSQISPIPQYMGSLGYHCWCPFNHESEGISSPRSNLSYLLGTTGRGASRMHCNTKDGVNSRDWTRFPDPLWRHSSYVQVGSPSSPNTCLNLLILIYVGCR
jgi:hypothetical protein